MLLMHDRMLESQSEGPMIATSHLPEVACIQLDAILGDAVTLKWSDLMPEPASGLIHVEYHVGPHGSVGFLKIWASTTRGYWDLVCDYFMCSGATAKRGFRFANGYKSEGLQRMLESIIQHPEILIVGTPPGADRMVQVYPPTDEDRVTASERMEAFWSQAT